MPSTLRRGARVTIVTIYAATAVAACSVKSASLGPGADASAPDVGDAAADTSEACAATAGFATTATSTTAIALAWTGAADVSATIARKTYCGTDGYATLGMIAAGDHAFTDSTVQSGYAYWYELTTTDPTGATSTVAIGAAAASGGGAACAGGGMPQDPGASATCAGTGTSGSDGGMGGGGVADVACPSGPATTGAATVACTNTSADVATIQAAVNHGGTVVLTGTCALTTGEIQLHNSVAITGTAHVIGNQGQIVEVDADDVTINGITFDQGTVGTGTAQFYSDFNFTNNTIENLWSGGTAGGPTGLSGTAIVNSTITCNTFTNLWGGGSPGYTNGVVPPNNGQAGVDSWGSVGVRFSGLDHVSITYNVFDKIANDAMGLNWSQFTGQTGTRATSAVVIAYNIFTHIRRIPLEIQSQPSYPNGCPGGCNGANTPTVGLLVAGNYVHDYSVYAFYDTWGSSLVPDGASQSQYLNNTFIANPGTFSAGFGGYAPCMEVSGQNTLTQGNICADATAQGNGFGAGIAQGSGPPADTDTYQMNVYCGAQKVTVLGLDGASSNAKTLDQYNYKNTTACPAGADLTQSAIDLATVSYASNTWSVSVVSNLSLRYVQFFLDAATTPFAEQTAQDVNPGFPTDRKWLYHAATSSLGTGHTIKAVATDVSGATATITQAI